MKKLSYIWPFQELDLAQKD